MKLDKRYIKFHEIGNNKYYLLPVSDEIHIVTESVFPIKKKGLIFTKNKDLVQGIKLLELTAPILTLFNELINMEVEKEDIEFPDMTTYKKIDNLNLRKTIEQYYISVTNAKIEEIKEDFENWLNNIYANSDLDDEKLKELESTNRKRLEQNIMAVKDHAPMNFIDFKWKSGDNLIVKRMLDNNMEFLYAQKIGSTYKIYYLYELDTFGTLTIYKVHCVKDTVKTMETFVYNREIIQEMLCCMVNNDL